MKKILTVVVASMALAGCSSFIDGTYQTVKVTTWPTNAVCDFSRDPGGDLTFSSIVSGETAYNIRRSNKNIYINCSKEGYADARQVLKPLPNGQAGILFAFTDAFVEGGANFERDVHLQLERL